MNISIRQAQENDWQDLRFIRLQALRCDPSVFSSNYQKESAMAEADWKSWLQDKDKGIFLLYEKDVPIGMTGIAVMRDDPGKKKAVLWGSWLDPRLRGKGLSQTMYQARVAWAQGHSTVEQVIVSHRASNTASKRANQKYGFRYTHDEDKIWPDGSSEQNVFYALTVKPVK